MLKGGGTLGCGHEVPPSVVSSAPPKVKRFVAGISAAAGTTAAPTSTVVSVTTNPKRMREP